MSRARQRAGVFTLALLGALAATLGPLAAPAAAHARLISTTPIADELLQSGPEAVELTFDEPVAVVEGGIQVIDPEGDRADRGSVEEADGGVRVIVGIETRRQGTYTVAWRVLSEDGHNLSGSFVFHVGVRTGAAETDDADSRTVGLVGTFGRWLAFAGLLGAGGAVVIAMLAIPSDRLLRARASRQAVVGALGGFLGVVLVLVAQTAEATGRGLLEAVSLTPELTLDTRTGLLTAARGACLLGAAILAGLRPVWRRAPWLTGLAVMGAAALSSMTGHAWTADRRIAAVAVDAVHLLAVIVWIGGLVGLLLCLPVAVDRVRVAGGFSKLALFTAGVVAATGTVSGAIQLGSIEALTATTYGTLLLAKVVGFATLVWFGWANRRTLLPLLERTATPLLRSLRGEVLVACVVLAVTAVLVDTPPGRVELSQPFSTSVEAEDAVIQVTVDPARAGANDIHFYFFEPDGLATLPVDAVEVTAAIGDIPPRRLDITPVTSNHVSAYGATLASSGTWTLVVTTVRAGITSTYTIEVQIR